MGQSCWMEWSLERQVRNCNFYELSQTYCLLHWLTDPESMHSFGFLANAHEIKVTLLIVEDNTLVSSPERIFTHTIYNFIYTTDGVSYTILLVTWLNALHPITQKCVLQCFPIVASRHRAYGSSVAEAIFQVMNSRLIASQINARLNFCAIKRPFHTCRVRFTIKLLEPAFRRNLSHGVQRAFCNTKRALASARHDQVCQ